MRKLFPLILLLLASPSFATIALVQKAKANTTSSSTVAVTLSGVAAGDFLVILPENNSGATTLSTAVDSSGDTINTAVAYATSGSHAGTGVYYDQNASAGAHTITITWSASGNSVLFVAEYSGVATSSAFDVGSPIAFSASTTIATASIIPASNGELLVFAVGQQGVSGVTYSSFLNGMTQEDLQNSAAPNAVWADLIQTTAASINGGATSTVASGAGSVIAAFKAAAGSSCTHQGYTSAGALAVPNGSSGSYWLKNGTFGTPDCSSVNYWQPTVGNFAVN